jgi:hypothetical protein
LIQSMEAAEKPMSEGSGYGSGTKMSGGGAGGGSSAPQ